MRKLVTVLAVCCALLVPLAGDALADNLLSLQVGAFSPEGDYPDEYESGADFGVFYTNTNNKLGFELGMHGHSTSWGSSEVDSVGMEFLLTFQDPMARVQPYAGLGVGAYAVTSQRVGQLERSGTGKGVVAEAGVRVFVESLFMGFQFKAISNEMGDFSYGGNSVNLLLGLIF